MADRMITVTSGEGGSFAKTEMKESEFLSQYRNKGDNSNESDTGEEGEEPKNAALNLSKMKKAKLVAIAEERGIKVTPDSETNQQIIDKITAAADAEK